MPKPYKDECDKCGKWKINCKGVVIEDKSMVLCPDCYKAIFPSKIN